MSGFQKLWQGRLPSRPTCLAVVEPYGIETLLALSSLSRDEMIIPFLVGDREIITAVIDANRERLMTWEYKIIDTTTPVDIACAMIIDKRCTALMKGNIHSDQFLRGIVRSKLVRPGRMMSHLAAFEQANGKIIFITDPSIFIKPTVEQKRFIVANAIETLQHLGYKKVNVALLSSVEVVSERILSSVEAKKVSDAFQGQDEVFVSGPMALDIAVSETAAKAKSVTSLVAGAADILVVPDLDSGNILCKGLNYLAHMPSASLIAGTRCPVIFTSRSASQEERIITIKLALTSLEKTY